jgi:hypothetical protein
LVPGIEFDTYPGRGAIFFENPRLSPTPIVRRDTLPFFALSGDALSAGGGGVDAG